MKLLSFRSLWGAYEAWETLFPKLKRAGFAGIEASLADINYPDTTKFAKLLRANDLQWICGIYSSWTDYIGPYPTLPVDQHLSNFKTQLLTALSVNPKPVHINCHSGSDEFSQQDAEVYFEEVLNMESELYPGNISHETHRGRIFYSPWTTLPVLAKFPNLKITLDLAHWTLVAERLISPEMISLAIERTAHVHARVGTPEIVQIINPEDDANKKWTQGHLKVWEAVWRAQKRAGAKATMLTPEYGPLEDGGNVPAVTLLTGDGDASQKLPPNILDPVVMKEEKRLRHEFNSIDWSR